MRINLPIIKIVKYYEKLSNIMFVVLYGFCC